MAIRPNFKLSAFKLALMATLVWQAAPVTTAQASSHREALAVLNEPCADNTDTYAWVKPGTHGKLYLIMNFNPLHEPGQGNQGLRACNGYVYQFHIGIGKSLRDRVVYRVKFKNKLTPEAAPTANDPLGGGNELLWQLTGGTEKMSVDKLVTPAGGGSPVSTILGKNVVRAVSKPIRNPARAETGDQWKMRVFMGGTFFIAGRPSVSAFSMAG